MLCSGCGKDIPFTGKVCPYCQRDKSADQGSQTMLYVFMAIGAAIGYFINDFLGLIIGILAGAAVGTMFLIANIGSAASKPPEVRVVPDPAPAPEKQEPDLVKRLSDLDTLKERGLITETEWALKRQSILDQL